jgi:hypothetical protein
MKLVKTKCFRIATVIVVCVIVLSILSLIFYHIHNRITLTVAFYGIPDTTMEEIKNKTREVNPYHSQFKVYDSSKQLPLGVSAKCDILFTHDGLQTLNLGRKTSGIPDQLFTAIPTQIKNAFVLDSTHYALPLLINDYMISYNKTLRTEAGIPIPQKYEQIEPYLIALKMQVDYPLFVAGKDDTNLLAFVSSLTASIAGPMGYKTLMDAVAAEKDFSTLLEVPLADVDGKTIRLSSILDIIVQWQNKQLIHPLWYAGSDQDINTLLIEHKVGVLYQNLSSRRKMNSKLIKYFETARFPESSSVQGTALISPVICAVLFRNTAGEQVVLSHLISAEEQTVLSNVSLLGPVTARAEAHDHQADDARYWAASVSTGPAPVLGDASFSSKKKAAKIAADIRFYLKK